MTWTIEDIKTLTEDHPDWVVEIEADCLSVSNDDGIDAFVYAGAQQIVAEVLLFPSQAVADQSKLNDLILRTHQLLPLTTICIKTVSDADYYVAFGALSAESKPEVVVEEIETLLANTNEFLDLYAEFLSTGEV